MSVVLSRFKIVYMPIPKAACTSVKAALASVDPDCPLTNEEILQNSSIVHSHFQTSRFRPHRWEPFSDGSWWRFAVVRDPLKRLLSVYTDRVRGRKELHNSPKLRKRPDLLLDPDPDFFFENLMEYIRNSSAVKHHALPSQLFIGPRPIAFDRIYKTDELGILANDLSERLGEDITIPKFNSSETNLSFSDLSSKAASVIRERLEPEYDHLSEFFENPFS
ncbi:sulfotransferase family protein [Phaeobacter sp. CNT1-3]|nr:sulfotransferase family protein [Phaeobacter sp. CNT1-3]